MSALPSFTKEVTKSHITVAYRPRIIFPKAFCLEHFTEAEICDQLVELKSPAGTSLVQLAPLKGTLAFRKDWSRVVTENSLQVGDYVTITKVSPKLFHMDVSKNKKHELNAEPIRKHDQSKGSERVLINIKEEEDEELTPKVIVDLSQLTEGKTVLIKTSTLTYSMVVKSAVATPSPAPTLLPPAFTLPQAPATPPHAPPRLLANRTRRSTILTLTKTNLHPLYAVRLKKEFALRYMPKESQMLILVSEDRNFAVKWNVVGFNLGKGWRELVKFYNLRVRDSCLLEAVDNTTFRFSKLQ